MLSFQFLMSPYFIIISRLWESIEYILSCRFNSHLCFLKNTIQLRRCFYLLDWSLFLYLEKPDSAGVYHVPNQRLTFYFINLCLLLLTGHETNIHGDS